MSRKAEQYNQSRRKLIKEIATVYNLDPKAPDFKEGFAQYEKKALEDRTAKYSNRIFEKYPVKLIEKVFNWSQENLSPEEFESEAFESIMIRYMSENPKDVSAGDIEKIYDKKSGRLKKFARDPLSDPLRWPDVAKAETGVVEELPPTPKVKPTAPTMPSQNQLNGMSSEQIGVLIKQARVAGVEE